MTVRGVSTIQQRARVEEDELRRMVGADPHRPGSAEARLLAEQIPVWAIVGHLRALTGTTELDEISEEAVNAAAHDYDISPMAVLAAWCYYDQHRAAIDARLEANAAALS